MAEIIKVGMKFSESVIVTEQLTVPSLPMDFNNMPPVLATPYLVALVEWTSLRGLQTLLEPGQRTVGTSISISHSAATPVGMKASAEVEIVEVKGKLITLKVLCRDEVQVIGEGVHGRAIIDYEKFMSRLNK